MLTCRAAAVVDNFAVLPNITWLDSENREVQSGSNDVTLGGPGELIFIDVTENNMGDYKCRACVIIEEVGIVDLCSSSVVAVSSTGMVSLWVQYQKRTEIFFPPSFSSCPSSRIDLLWCLFI